MVDKLWKKVERRVAAMLGTTRTGPTGRHTFDCIADHLYLGAEVKSKKKLPDWLTDAVTQAQEHSQYELDTSGRYISPIVALVEKGMSDRDILCVMKLEHYVSLRKIYIQALNQHERKER